MASEQGAFGFRGGGRLDLRQAPSAAILYVFGEGRSPRAVVEEQSAAWEDIKASERGGESALEGVPQALPALMRAYKLSKRAARVGFDFEHASQTADKVEEELAEVREAAENHRAAGNHGAAPSQETFEEVGDLLFAAANLARKLGVDAESALRAANLKFERRFRAMELLAKARGQEFSGLKLDAQESLWLDVKRAEIEAAGPGSGRPAAAGVQTRSRPADFRRPRRDPRGAAASPGPDRRRRYGLRQKHAAAPVLPGARTRTRRPHCAYPAAAARGARSGLTHRRGALAAGGSGGGALLG